MISRARRERFRTVPCLVAVFFFVARSAFAFTEAEKQEIRDEAKDFKYNEVIAKSGLKYRVPEDMPIETRNGIEAPIPFDEYTYGKFKRIEGRLDRIEESLARIEKAVASPKPQEKLRA